MTPLQTSGVILAPIRDWRPSGRRSYDLAFKKNRCGRIVSLRLSVRPHPPARKPGFQHVPEFTECLVLAISQRKCPFR